MIGLVVSVVLLSLAIRRPEEHSFYRTQFYALLAHRAEIYVRYLDKSFGCGVKRHLCVIPCPAVFASFCLPYLV